MVRQLRRKALSGPRPPWPGGAHALAALGPLTEEVVSGLLQRRSPYALFRKLEEVDLKRIAQAFETGWSDAQAAEVIEAYDRHPEKGTNVEVSALCRWIRQHPNRADCVLDCMSVLPPEGVSLIRVLSEAGSQKRVYLANWRLTQKEIVLKRLIGSRKQQEAIFERESQTHPFSMGHPNIIETHPLTNLKGHKFLAEEYLPVVLGDRWESGGVQEAANLLYDICKALHYIHTELGLVHGDIKPDNIGGRDGAYILLDFGICRPIADFTRDATATGSLRTRAPELFEVGSYLDPPKADVWAIAATVFKATTGRFPFLHPGEKVPRISTPEDRARLETRIRRRIQGEWEEWVEITLLPCPLQNVLKAALVRDPEHRAAADEMVALCEKHLAGFLRSTSGNGHVTATEELRQLLQFLPKDESLNLMPLAARQVLKARLKAFSQLVSLAPADARSIEDLLKRIS